MCGGEKVKDKNGILLKEGNAVRELRKDYFRDLTNVDKGENAVLT